MPKGEEKGREEGRETLKIIKEAIFFVYLSGDSPLWTPIHTRKHPPEGMLQGRQQQTHAHTIAAGLRRERERERERGGGGEGESGGTLKQRITHFSD